MSVTIKGDKAISNVLTINQKALHINLNDNIYGTFSEVGAGQETVRNFFRAGSASGTIAKSMSAYDKDFSDAIYGVEDDKRYVTESRLKKMLQHEMDIIEDRLKRKKHPDRLFFSYANTVATIDFAKKFKGHGWVGIRFQLDPLEDYNDIVLHLRFKQNDTTLQQETLGKLGVNLIYGAFYLNDKPKDLLISFYDNIRKDELEIDMISFSGPRFMYIDIFELSKELYLKEKKVDKKNTKIIFEITLTNLRSEGEINERDFLDRAELLCSLGKTVMITNFQKYFKLVEYFAQFTKARMGLAMGVYNLIQIFDEKYYRDMSGGILEAFGKLFHKDLKIYLYPLKNHETGTIQTSQNLKVHPRVKELYKYFKFNGKMVDIKDYNPEILDILSRKVLVMIAEGKKGWEDMLPNGIADLIKDQRLFGYRIKR